MILSFDAKRAFHNNRGLGNYSRDVIRLMTSYFPDNNYLLFNPINTNESGLLKIPQNTKIISPANFAYKLLPVLWRSKGCVLQIKKLKPDIYHGLSQELPWGIHKTKTKTVVTMHDAIFVKFPELYPASYRKIFTQKNKYSVKVADKIIAISKQTKNDFIEFFDADPSKIEVVYQGCNNIFRQKIADSDLSEIRKKYNLPETFMLEVGAIEKRKNLETIVRAMSISKTDIPLVVVGNRTAYLIEIKHLISKLKLGKQIMFLHDVATSELPAIYTMSSLFVYPSRYEGFGIPILEALCTETPVLTSRGSCFGETGGDAACYVDYDNAEEMAFAMNKILSDTNLQKSMIEKGIKHAGLFTDNKVAANLMKVYNSIV